MEKNLEVTEVKIFPIKKPDPNLFGFCTVTLNDAIRINSIRILKNEQGLKFTWPSSYSKAKDKAYDIVTILDSDLKKNIEGQILAELSLMNLDENT